MAENQSRLKGTPEPFILTWQPTDNLHTLLRGESDLLDMLSDRTPLPTILNAVCSALEAQIAKVTAVLTLAEEDAPQAPPAPTVSQFGYSVFYCSEIVSRQGELLASLEIYCCVPRTPSRQEINVIERAMQIASRAIEREGEDDNPVALQGQETKRWADFHTTMGSKN
jgi:hypothetical protein